MVPDDWKRGLLVKLTKKGDLSWCGNWRGIMLLSIPSKVLTRIILNRMKVAVDKALRDEQARFRNDRSYIDQIATLGIIVEQSIELSSPLYLLFMDLRKPSTLWIGRLSDGFFVIMVYLIKSSTCLRFSIRALLAKCFMEELWPSPSRSRPVWDRDAFFRRWYFLWYLTGWRRTHMRVNVWDSSGHWPNA